MTGTDGGGASRRSRPPSTAGIGEEGIRAVLDVVDTIPCGRVMSYGDIARHLGIPSARQVGQIMARRGHEVPWQRVVMADGSPASHDPAGHLARLRTDGVPLRDGRVVMDVARWHPGRPDDAPGHSPGSSPSR